ncbi:MAG: hypothetical protein ABIU05_20760 [Nitrospirales bacterium]
MNKNPRTDVLCDALGSKNGTWIRWSDTRRGTSHVDSKLDSIRVGRGVSGQALNGRQESYRNDRDYPRDDPGRNRGALVDGFLGRMLDGREKALRWALLWL